jgi:hypothetical protein
MLKSPAAFDSQPKNIVMFNPAVTILTPVPKWFHPPHRFECLHIFSRMFSQKDGIRSFVGSIDAMVHCWGATIRKYVVSSMSLFWVVSLAILREVHLGWHLVIWTSLNRRWSSRRTVGCLRRSLALTGRATRAYPGYEKASGRILFLKDSWRAKCLEKESDILKTLNDAKVRNVPNLVCGGDIEGHRTLTNDYVSDNAYNSWKCGCNSLIVERIHHRFVGDFVGRHLSEFTSTKQMMLAVRDAYIGMSFAMSRSRCLLLF